MTSGLIFSFAGLVGATTIGESFNFNVDQNFDLGSRSQVISTLVKTSNNLYFYVDKNWWDGQVEVKKTEILANFDALSIEFSNKIYPTLTSVFGSEWNPGVDGDSKIILLFHPMIEGSAGYFRSTDEYLKLQTPDSNEKEMLYLSVSNIDSPQLKVFLAHEFMHLITFNQKDRMNGVSEEVWLNEARADYASTILGYDTVYEGSNLQKRMKDFLSNPSDSLTEWQEKKSDYAVASVFMHYLVDNYSIKILSDSLKSKLVGIASLNESLLKNNSQEDFDKIFTNWTIANIINSCSGNTKYCYLNQNLKNLKISPVLNFLPLAGNSSLSVTNVTKNWSANWQKIIGGNGNLLLEFSSLAGLDFSVPYIIFDKDNNFSVNFLKLDAKQKGQITIKDFGTKYSSLVIIPSLQTKIAKFDGMELTYPYTFKVSISQKLPTEDPLIIENLLAQIESLKKQILAIKTGNKNSISCSSINNNLYFGLSDNNLVTCLQEFLILQGDNIYPEKMVTGNFGNLTKLAVVRFQTKYKIPSTGFVGTLTRAKINELFK